VSNTIQILLLEDAPADAVLIDHELRQAGLDFQTVRVETKEDFLHELQRHPPNLILSDHGLPDFDGFAALAIAQDRRPDIPFIFVTGSVGEEVVAETLKSGATDFVLKSRLRTNLGPAVRHALREAEEGNRRKQVETALRESEERYRQLVGMCPAGLFVVHTETGRIVYANPALANLVKAADPAQLVGKSVEDIFPNQRWQTASELIQKSRESGSPTPFIGETLLRLDGTSVEVEMAATPLMFQEKPSWQVLVHDLSERKRAAETIRESEARQTAILETALDAIITIDAQGVLQEWNPAAERIFGYSRAEALNRPMDELIIPSSLREVYRDGLAEYLITGVGSLLGRPIELSMRRKDGKEFSAELAIARVPWKEPPIYTGFIRDNTERKTSEQALRKSEERYRLLVEGVEDYAICMLSAEGLVCSWNVGAERLEGYSTEEILGKPFACFFIPEDIKRGKPEELLKTAEVQGGLQEEGWRARKNGSRYWASMLLTPMRDETGRLSGFSMIARDISERKRIEDEVRTLNQALETRVAERTAELETTNQELEAFSYSISHDLRAPLRHLHGFAEILRKEAAPKLDAAECRYLMSISDSAKRMGQMIDGLLEFSRMSRAAMRRIPIQLGTLVEIVRQELGHEAAERNVEWVVGALPEVRGDPTLLHQVLTNLIGNALKYTRTRARARIAIGWQDAGHERVFWIRDNGVGFNMTYVDRLFGVFQRLHRPEDFEGTGIGLANVRRIIQRHGGRTWAEGVIDGGATFYFSLPK
jgi:PAS domain S-box-containing protein